MTSTIALTVVLILQYFVTGKLVMHLAGAKNEIWGFRTDWSDEQIAFLRNLLSNKGKAVKGTNDDQERAWSMSARYSGDLVGALETTLLFSAFAALDAQDAALVVAGYFAFKVACKWEVWAHVYQAPNDLGDFIGKTDWHVIRFRLGHFLFNRFVCGTISNLLIAIAGSLAYLTITAPPQTSQIATWL